jgi:hypothetical protein
VFAQKEETLLPFMHVGFCNKSFVWICTNLGMIAYFLGFFFSFLKLVGSNTCLHYIGGNGLLSNRK